MGGPAANPNHAHKSSTCKLHIALHILVAATHWPLAQITLCTAVHLMSQRKFIQPPATANTSMPPTHWPFTSITLCSTLCKRPNPTILHKFSISSLPLGSDHALHQCAFVCT